LQDIEHIDIAHRVHDEVAEYPHTEHHFLGGNFEGLAEFEIKVTISLEYS
jgi:hypothetical protein